MFTSFNWSALAVAITAVFIFWSFSSTSSSPFTRSFPRLQNKRICLIIAHPDDEAMFFAPTVLALTKPELGNHLKILCFSTGDADGLGETRKKELQKSAKQLGLRSDSDVFIVDDVNRFPDGMDKEWDEGQIASLLASAFAPDMSAQKAGKQAQTRNKAPTATIDVLITFDQHGISNHPNHRSLFYGAVNFIRALMKDKTGFTCPITLYTLTTTSIFRKYIGVLDAPLTMVLGVWSNLVAAVTGARQKDAAGSGVGPASLLFVSSINDWLTAQSAMVICHKSQMVWFRWGWISIGRYMTVNDLKRQKV